MAAPKTCRNDGEDRKKGNAHHCFECWLRGRPIVEQIAHAEWRLAAIPPELRVQRVPKEDWPEGRRWCSGCQSFRLWLDFNQGASQCKACVAPKAHAARIGREYNLTKEQYDALYKLQGGRCAFCGERFIQRPAVDHDHVTGQVRGLLCGSPDWGCNYKIAAKMDKTGDPIAMALRMLDYYRNPPADKVLG